MVRNESILVVNEPKGEAVAFISQKFPGVPLFTSPTHQIFQDQLDVWKPTIVLSFKERRLSLDDMRALIEYPSVHWLHCTSAGVDHLPEWNSEKVVVTNGAGVSAPFMAQYVIGAMLMVCCRFPENKEQQKARIWNQQPWVSADRRVLLLVGLGAVGRAIARAAKSFGIYVIGVRTTSIPVDDVDETWPASELDRLVPRADFISLQLPSNGDTNRLIGADRLRLMKQTAWITNVGRGQAIDETALIAALQERRIAGAVLDVFESEPLAQESPLWGMDNAIVTPHVSGWSTGWMDAGMELFAQNLRNRLCGTPLVNQVVR